MRARVTMVPGGLEPIADDGGDENSPFAWPLVRALSDDLDVIDGEYNIDLLACSRPLKVTPYFSNLPAHTSGDVGDG